VAGRSPDRLHPLRGVERGVEVARDKVIEGKILKHEPEPRLGVRQIEERDAPQGIAGSKGLKRSACTPTFAVPRWREENAAFRGPDNRGWSKTCPAVREKPGGNLRKGP